MGGTGRQLGGVQDQLVGKLLEAHHPVGVLKGARGY